MARIVLQPLSRVEGHGRVELVLQGRRLQQVRVALVESPRLFEQMLVGRSASEVPELICRICAICSAVHKLTALAALERLMAIEIPPAARLVRELLLLGGHLQSHALHLFCLILPDFSDQPSVLELLRRGDPLAMAGIELKAFGNRLQEVAGGRVIHPVIPIMGGVARCPPAVELVELQRSCARWQDRWPALAADFARASSYPSARPAVGTMLATEPADCFTLSGQQLLPDGDEPLPVEDYAELLAEVPVPHSRARQSAGGRGPFLVGALARQRLFTGRAGGRSALPATAGIHANNAAQLEEIGWAIGRAGEIVSELTQLRNNEPLVTAPGPLRAGVGTAAFEAPRGLLIHHYVVDDWGQVAAADIVTPTAINQVVMERQLLADLQDVDEDEELRRAAERIVRAYDPCISCAVHVVRC